jgi:hypothetical protein
MERPPGSVATLGMAHATTDRHETAQAITWLDLRVVDLT